MFRTLNYSDGTVHGDVHGHIDEDDGGVICLLPGNDIPDANIMVHIEVLSDGGSTWAVS